MQCSTWFDSTEGFEHFHAFPREIGLRILEMILAVSRRESFFFLRPCTTGRGSGVISRDWMQACSGMEKHGTVEVSFQPQPPYPPQPNNQQPTTDNQQPTTNNQQPTTNNPQPTTHNPQPTTTHNNTQQHTPDPLVWCAGSLPKRPRITHAVRDFAFLLGPVDIWDGDWVSFGVRCVTAEDVRVWPYSVSLLVKILAFLGTLHWPAGSVDFGVGGSFFC